MKKPFIIFFIIFCFAANLLLSQTNSIIEGNVSYITPQFIYIKFQNTDGLNVNDTLYQSVKGKYVARLIIKFKSSISAACEKIAEFDIKTGDSFYAFISNNGGNSIVIDSSMIPPRKDSLAELSENTKPVIGAFDDLSQLKGLRNKFTGKYSILSYSNVDNYSKNDYQNWRHSLRINYDKIGNSDLTFSTYSIFNYRSTEWSQITKNYFQALKVYDFHFLYEFTNNFKIWMGRFLNPKISNISTIDGLLLEAELKLFNIGVVAGFRPDWSDFTFNPKLFEYGVYLARKDSFYSNTMENTVSYFQQTNNSKTDRRFLYLQHSMNLNQKLNLFASSEIDLYKLESGVEKNQFSFTSIFLSANYYILKNFSLNVNYDARKNVIYYETYRSLIDSIIENETLQGFRVRANVKLFKYLGVSIFTGYRFRNSDIKPSRNFGTSIYYSKIPLIEFGLNASFNKLISNYIDGDVYSIQLTKNLDNFNSDFLIGYRRTNYRFTISNSNFFENALLIDFNSNLLRIFSISFSYEGVFETSRTLNRFLTGVTVRF